MSMQIQTILLVSDDAALCAVARRELESSNDGVRVAAVSSVAAARSIAHELPPDVILLENASMHDKLGGKSVALEAVVSSLAAYAPVVVIGTEQQAELSALVAAGTADYVEHGSLALPQALEYVEQRLRKAQSGGKAAENCLEKLSADFGEVLRHELNNPLTGILGNAELLLSEIRRKQDGKLPQRGQQRVETIAALAVRLREAVRRLSDEWETRWVPAHRAPVEKTGVAAIGGGETSAGRRGLLH